MQADEAQNDDLDKIELTEIYIKDLEIFAEDCLVILSKSGERVAFRFNRVQKYLHHSIEAQLRKTGRVRVLILKGRQQGCSTYVEGRFYWKVTLSEGASAFILTHEDEATKTIFGITERFHENNPDSPTATRASARELKFDQIDSGFGVATAGNKGAGRSKTILFFHGSEVAHWPNADAHKAGAMQAVPNFPGTEIILESTAFGVGGMFHDMWKLAEAAQRGDLDEHGQRVVSEFIPIFIPWFWQDEYREKVTPGFKRTKEEKQLAKRYKLDDEQLMWRRTKIAGLKPSDGGNPEDLFKQEYPCNPEEAFLFSGRLVFSPGDVQTALVECFSPKFRAEIVDGKPLERADGRLRVWKKPESGKRYVIGADVAEGLTKGDFSSADVLEVGTGRQMAQWHGHIPPDMYGDVLFDIGVYYNIALIGVERNNHGLTTLTKLKDRRYRRLYVQEDLTHRADDKETKKLGWLTTEKSKLKIIDQLSAELRDGGHGIACEETISEMTTFVIDENGKYTAKPGCFDDRVMSRAIAGEMLRHAPTQHVPQAGKKGEWVY